MKNKVSLKLRLTRKKPVDYMVEDSSAPGDELKRSITLFQLTMFGSARPSVPVFSLCSVNRFLSPGRRY